MVVEGVSGSWWQGGCLVIAAAHRSHSRTHPGPALPAPPPAAADGECQREDLSSAGGHRVVTIDGYEDVPPNDELALKKAVSRCVLRAVPACGDA